MTRPDLLRDVDAALTMDRIRPEVARRLLCECREALAAAEERGRSEERERSLAVARGCVEDYLGGYGGQELRIFRHGMQTVINALHAPPDDTQTRVLERLGRPSILAAIERAAHAPTEGDTDTDAGEGVDRG